jgi:hypothetical protein
MKREELEAIKEHYGCCDTCGEQATELCIDLVEIDNYETGLIEHERAPTPVRRGCNKHPVHSRILYLERWPPLGQIL